MLEEAHEAASDNRLLSLAFVGGFVLFTLVSAGLETVMASGGGSTGQSSSVIEQSGTYANAQ